MTWAELESECPSVPTTCSRITTPRRCRFGDPRPKSGLARSKSFAARSTRLDTRRTRAEERNPAGRARGGGGLKDEGRIVAFLGNRGGREERAETIGATQGVLEGSAEARRPELAGELR